MDKKIRILMLEDNSDDAELVKRELQKGGIPFTAKRVETEKDFVKELEQFNPDLILADYKIPLFDGLRALKITKETYPDLPFIFVSGTIGEDFAIETYKEGATDYVLKDRLARLVPAVRRAMREAEMAKDRKQAEEALRESEQKLRNIIEHSNELFYIHDPHQRLSYISPQSMEILGRTPEEMMVDWTRLLTDDPLNEKGVEFTKKALETGERQKPYLLELYKKDGNRVLLEIDESPFKDKAGKVLGMIGAARDVTKRIQAEDALKQSEQELKKRVQELEEFYHLAVGRELRMIELKQEIESLKEELAKYKKVVGN
jgi:PAS domain S-box-containing protein